MEIKHKILEILQNNKPQLCVLSTFDGTKVQSAVMAYTVLEDVSIIVSTHSTTRKWHNIKAHPEISLTTGWDFIHPNIQYEGIAAPIEQGIDYELHEKMYYNAHPELLKFKSTDSVFIRIKPLWIRVTDFASQPPLVEEQQFDK